MRDTDNATAAHYYKLKITPVTNFITAGVIQPEEPQTNSLNDHHKSHKSQLSQDSNTQA